MDELKHARDVLHRLIVAIDGMPAGVRSHDRPDAADTQSKLLHALVRDGWREPMRELRAAWTAATALPERATLRFKQPKADGGVQDREWEYRPRVYAWQGPEKLESLLAAIPDELASWDRALELARELESVVAKLKDQHGRPPHIGIMFNSFGEGTGWGDYDRWVCRTQQALAQAFSPLSEAADSAWRSIESGVTGECVWSGKGWTSIESAWAKVPPATKPAPKAKKSRSNQPIEDRVKAAMFGMYEDGEGFASKAKVARRMGFKSASNLNKPKADKAFRDTLALLVKLPPKEPKTQARSKQTRLAGEKARREESLDT